MIDFKHIQNWIFDLDNTLYPAHCQLFTQIFNRMIEFVSHRLNLSMAEARALQKTYNAKYGTTLSGLMKEHNIVAEDFMDYVHDIDVSGILANPALAQQLENLPGRCFVYTNGSVKHAHNITSKLGIDHVFDAVFDIKAAHYLPKPHSQSYERFLSLHDLDPKKSVMFEDLAINLQVPHALGMETVLICEEASGVSPVMQNALSTTELRSFKALDVKALSVKNSEEHVRYATSDLTQFLSSVMTHA